MPLIKTRGDQRRPGARGRDSLRRERRKKRQGINANEKSREKETKTTKETPFPFGKISLIKKTPGKRKKMRDKAARIII
ncbi:MAG: hypothetical protein NTW06_03145 [Candidatus Falkowbacteria bacterium]|nr:hypothetical protein [Candidatus Falkowbacteria bacterium]